MEEEGQRVEARYLSDYDVTVWEYDDHILLAYGNVRESGDTAVNPVWIKKTGGDYDLSKAFTAEVEVDVSGMSEDDFFDAGQGLTRDETEDEYPTESLY